MSKEQITTKWIKKNFPSCYFNYNGKCQFGIEISEGYSSAIFIPICDEEVLEYFGPENNEFGIFLNGTKLNIKTKKELKKFVEFFKVE